MQVIEQVTLGMFLAHFTVAALTPERTVEAVTKPSDIWIIMEAMRQP